MKGEEKGGRKRFRWREERGERESRRKEKGKCLEIEKR